MRRKIYLDVDGVFLRSPNLGVWNGEWEVAPHAIEFLDWAVANHAPLWLTSRDMLGNGEGIAAAFTNVIGGGTKLLELASKIPSQAWESAKTTAIDFSDDFIWLDDCPRTDDLLTLEREGAVNCWIEVNTDLRPEDLLRVMQLIVEKIA